jgi:nucleotidyltransferase/DNA polymerase involved in DNA repair
MLWNKMRVVKPKMAISYREPLLFWDIIEKAEITHIQIGQKASMQNQNRNRLFDGLGAMQPGVQHQDWSGYAPPPLAASVADTASASGPDSSLSVVERTRLRQGVMHVRIRHFYCTLEEQADPSLRGQAFVVGTGTGRPNEPGRVIDASPAALKQGVSPGMPLRRAYRLVPRARFLPASYERYQPVLQRVKECYRVYSRIIESIPFADAYIDLRGCELIFDSPVALGERLCMELGQLGLVPLIGIANGKALAELAALLSRRDGRQGVLYVPPGREASFVQTLPLSILLQVRAAGNAALSPVNQGEQEEHDSSNSRPSDSETRGEQTHPAAIAEAVNHLKDFGIINFAQVALLNEEGLVRRLGQQGSWIYQLACGDDNSLVVPDAPPLSQNARVRFQHAADADEACEAIRRLADYLSGRLREQRLKGRVIALVLWPNRPARATRQLVLDENGEEVAVTAAEETIGGQMGLERHTDEADVIAHHILMLFAHYHRPAYHYLQVQVRIGDIISQAPGSYVPPPARPRGRLTRKL